MSACKYCSDPIRWTREAGDWRPLNADGTPHRCVRKAKPVAATAKGKLVRGADYKPACGECSTPPWEVCACSDARAAA